MSGLPCEACQEPTHVIPTGQLLDDANGRVLYRRFRVCTNTACEFYLIRRETLEVAVPLTPNVFIVSPQLNNLGHLRLPPRTTPPPDLAPHPSEP